MIDADEYPESLMVRDTHLVDELGGLGQRIYTTAGVGYPKQRYVRADLIDKAKREALRWALGIAKAEGVGFLEIEINYMLNDQTEITL